MAFRGLTQFISDIRQCTTKEQEQKRIMKEMANIRSNFKDSHKLKSYDKRKYVCKLLYAYMLGYEVDFGIMQAIDLMSSTVYAEKVVGYLATSVLLDESSDLLMLIINTIGEDLQSSSELYQCVALGAVANIGSQDTAQALGPMVQKMLMGTTGAVIRKKSALCLLRLFRKYPDLIIPEEWEERLVMLLTSTNNLGVLTSVMSLVLGLVSAAPEEYETVAPQCVRLLHKIILGREFSSSQYNEYVYYGVVAPWLQVKLLRCLQYFPPPEERVLRMHLIDVLSSILKTADLSSRSSPNRVNIVYSILFEAINLIIRLDCDNELLVQAAVLLGRFLSGKDTNVRYLTLEAMAHLATLQGSMELIQKHQSTVLDSLKDSDISIRKRALDLLYVMTDKDNAKEIVERLLEYLVTSDLDIREELVLKIAILAEKFPPDLTWYVDTILNLISKAGEYVSDDIWYRVVQIVTNADENLQFYAAYTIFKVLVAEGAASLETTRLIGAYLLGEYGNLIAEEEGSGPEDQFFIVNDLFALSQPNTQAVMLSTIVKFINLYPEITDDCLDFLNNCTEHIDTELQQRANEYVRLLQVNEDIMPTVLDIMPPFPDRESSLIRRFVEKDDTVDRRAWNLETIADKEGAEGEEGEESGEDEEEGEEYEEEEEDESGDGELIGAEEPESSSSDGGLIDLLGGGGGGSSSSSSGSSSSSSGLSLFDTLDAGSSGNSKEPENLSEFRALCTTNKAVLLNTQQVQVGYQAMFQKQFGKVALFVGNKLGSELSDFNVALEDSECMKFKVTGALNSIPSRKQLQHTFDVMVTAPFSEPPVVTLSFSSAGTQYAHAVKLPLVMTKFVSGVTFSSADFGKRWTGLAQNGSQVQSVGPAPGVSSDSVKTLLANLNMTFHDIDGNQSTVYSAGLFTFNNGSVGCLLLVEVDANNQRVRVTARTTNQAASQGLVDLVLDQLANA